MARRQALEGWTASLVSPTQLLPVRVGADRPSADLAALVLELLDGLDERADARERQRPVGVGHHGGPDLVCAGGGAVVRQLLRGAEGLGGAKGAL